MKRKATNPNERRLVSENRRLRTAIRKAQGILVPWQDDCPHVVDDVLEILDEAFPRKGN